MDNNIQPDYTGAYAKIYEKATPESGTGKYYNEKKPTTQQLKAREKYSKIKDLTNKGKHKEASALYKEAKYDNTKSPDYEKKKAALIKKHGGADKIKGHPQLKEGRFRREWEEFKAGLREDYIKKFDLWVESLSVEGYDLDRWEENVNELVETFINENGLENSKESVFEALLGESEKVAQKAYKRATELAQKRRNKGYKDHGYNAYRPGKNERAGYGLAQSARSKDSDLESQKQPTDTSQSGHYKNRDKKETVGKRGKPLKTPKYKLSLSQRVDHHSNKAWERRDPKKNPKHEANKK